MNRGSRFVVDASVGIKLFVTEPLSEITHALFERLAGDPRIELFVPDLFYVECTNILLKYVRQFGLSFADAIANLADLGHLALDSTPTAYLMEEALVLAYERSLTAYDACYAVLARRKGIPLITADEQIVKTVDWALKLDDFEL